MRACTVGVVALLSWAWTSVAAASPGTCLVPPDASVRTPGLSRSVALPLTDARAESTSPIERRPSSRDGNGALDAALEEMLYGGYASGLRWDGVPALVVLMPVMEYAPGPERRYRATERTLTPREADSLVADLSEALSTLTAGVFDGFGAIRFETPAAGEFVDILRPGHIVVGRYAGVRDRAATLGFGGRMTRGDVIRGGSIILDDEFDRSSNSRRLLRMHELGHALGYNHVHSQASIMNPRLGSGPTAFDLAAARLAFQPLDSSVHCE